jgi:hypothetical protein
MDWILALQDKYSIGVENTNWKKKDMIWEKKKKQRYMPHFNLGMGTSIWSLRFHVLVILTLILHFDTILCFIYILVHREESLENLEKRNKYSNGHILIIKK